ncbi:hypothetical protein FUA23_18095 [Neolewinella aurantiaca]|uniref:D-serine dehydratase-like domain-containing protein n=1 Tax=Neolewinella aurantiaca TaxID=2602767 RepID=A0A5C7FAF4_9BACT|nr:alanine racemase [Neolewinella aurantiaca]TXF87612.1 hypothetical protein FUA23_18095 [Neolewinella aurantiaca]
MLENITSPTLLVDQSKVNRNVQRMADRALRHNLTLRPHFKTHQSGEVGEWVRSFGVNSITVTSLRMAREFAQCGWEDITIAMPLNPRELPGIGELAQQVYLSVFLVDPETAGKLSKEIAKQIGYFIELDAGYGRSGVKIENLNLIAAIIEAAGNHHCRGFYVHSGHTYEAGDKQEIDQIHEGLMRKIANLKSGLSRLAGTHPSGPVRTRLAQTFEFAIGDTPACSTQESFNHITSIGPGNFVYYDLVQAGLGACSTDDIAVCLAAPVVQVLPHKNQAIVHAGWVQLGKDRLPDGTHGRVVKLKEDGSWSASLADCVVLKLSQEHGTLQLTTEVLQELSPGDLLGILPVHACATVHGMRATGEQLIIAAPGD